MLTELAIRALKPRPTLYRVADANGLALEVTPAGAKHWRYRYRWAGKAQMISLGTYPVTTLAMARQRHLDARRQLSNGQNPAQEKRAARRDAITLEKGRFPTFALEWLEKRSDDMAPRTYAKAEAIIRQDLIPSLRHANIASLTTPEAMAALEKIAGRAPHMAVKAMGYLTKMVDKAIKDGLREDGKILSLRGAVKLPPATSVPAATDPDSLRRVLLAIDAHPSPVVREALKLTAYTAQRPSNVVQARWEQFEGQVWTIPGELMKTRKPHQLPLPTQAMEILANAQDWAGNSEWVFPAQARRGTPHLHRDTLSKALRDAGLAGVHVPHGFRAAMRTLMAEEHDADDEILEAQLAHTKGTKTDQAYNRAKFMKRRAVAMQEWADYLHTLRAIGTSDK